MVRTQVTIKEIAKEAGVSIATVSMILNNKDKNISNATRNRVLKIANQMNYIPNSMARSLVTKRTKTIGLLMPDITNPFFPEIARGAEDRANKSRYSIIFCNTDDNLTQEDRYIDILSEKMVDGIIFTHSADREGGSKGLSRCRVPIVLIDRNYDSPNVKGKVLVDNFHASYKGVNYMIEQGYKHIAYLAGSMNTQTAKDRLEGYKKALEDNNIRYDNNFVKLGEYKSQWGTVGTKKLLEEGLFFDGIFCGNDLIAIGAIKALKEAKINVPKDIGVMGFDDIYMAGMVDPPLTTIKQPNYEMGYRAVDQLIKRIDSKSRNTEKLSPEENTIILDTELIIRESTKRRR